MHPIYSKVGIVSLFMILFFSLNTTAYGETCETKEDIYIQILDNDRNILSSSKESRGKPLKCFNTTSDASYWRIAIHDAIAAAKGTGIVVLPSADIHISAFIDLKSGVTLEGTAAADGTPLTTIHNVHTGDPVTLKMHSHTGVKKIIFNGKRTDKLYNAKHRAIQATAIDQTKTTTDLVDIYPTAKRLENITIEDVHIKGFNGFGIYLEHVDNVTIKGSDILYKKNMVISDIGYAGIAGYSANNVDIRNVTVKDLWPGETVGSAKQSYGIAFSHRKVNPADIEGKGLDVAASQAVLPPSNTIMVDGNVVANNPTWEGIDTHSGQNVSFINNIILNTRFPIIVGGLDYDSGKLSAYPPKNITISNNRISRESDYTTYGIHPNNNIITERGIAVNGTQFTDLDKNMMGFLENVEIKDNYINNVKASLDTRGGIGIHVTKNATIESNKIENSNINGIVFMSSNKQTKIIGNEINNISPNATFPEAGIGVRGSHNNGNDSNDYTTKPLTMQNTLIDTSNTYKNVGIEFFMGKGGYNLLSSANSRISPASLLSDSTDWSLYETTDLMQDERDFLLWERDGQEFPPS
ncbi:right-handed parallel beta-helix repeat-containing protein [Peribacillus frigoritolerans]|uniref:right-handed parallel beta-helix repeat-containing protein n=1 Tax=Peribacillus frigoritolerans TaxID=450367 RepID=UPI0007BFAD70